MSLTVYLAFIIFTLTGLIDSLKLQPVIELKVQGIQPLNPMMPQMSFISMVETPDDSLWFFLDNEIWNFDREKLEWSKKGNISFDDHQIVSGYDPFHNQFLFWSSGVGKVFTWRYDQSVPTRIDKSDHHKTQFGHFGFIEPSTGNIYAFGGSGYWQTRSFITMFDHEIKEWSIVPIEQSSLYPSERMSSNGAYVAPLRQLHIFGGYSYEFSRADISNESILLNDYWVFDFKTSTWMEKKLYNQPSTLGFYDGALQNQFASLSRVDHEGQLVWYIVNTDKIDYLQLLVFDITRDFGVYLPVYFPAAHVSALEYDESKNRLLVYNIHKELNAENVPLVQILSYDLPSADQVRQIMDEIRSGESENELVLSNTVVLIVSLFLPAFILSVWYYFRKRKKQNRVHLPSAPPKNAPREVETFPIITGGVSLEIRYHGNPSILINNKNVTDQFTPSELSIFLWLFWKRYIGKTYQSTDLIEDVFWNDFPNQDYVRKQRNTSLKLLNIRLESVFKNHLDRNDWIIDRNAYNDKRKKEYAINLDKLNVVCDLNGDFFSKDEILQNCEGRWVDQIRSEYAIWKAA